MGESLTEQRRVSEEGLRVVNSVIREEEKTVPEEEARLTTCQQPGKT